MMDVDPLVRLEASRIRLRLQLQQWQIEQEPAPNNTHRSWMDALRADPGTRVLLDALHLWWAQQPWHQATAALAASLKRMLNPLAQRRPLMLVLIAAAIGSALMLFKPWRWLSISTLAAGLLPQLLPKLLELLRPLHWADMLNGWLQPRSKTDP
jgi:hypothetical protein